MLQNLGATVAVADEVIRETTTQNFVKDVVEESRRQPVLVDFWAPWCGPCKMVSPLVERMGSDNPGRLKVVKLNTDEAPELSVRYGIQGIPLLVLIKDGSFKIGDSKFTLQKTGVAQVKTVVVNPATGGTVLDTAQATLG